MPETNMDYQRPEVSLAPQQESLTTDLSLTAADAESPAPAESTSDATGESGSSLWTAAEVSVLDEASPLESIPEAASAMEAPNSQAVMDWSDQGPGEASLTDLMAELEPPVGPGLGGSTPG
jgi:hypothetical protein